MATLMKSNGETSNVAPANGQEFTLAELQGYVGGYIQCLYPPDGSVLVINEDGKLNGLPLNQAATRIARGRIMADDFIVGDALQCSTKEMGD